MCRKIIKIKASQIKVFFHVPYRPLLLQWKSHKSGRRRITCVLFSLFPTFIQSGQSTWRKLCTLQWDIRTVLITYCIALSWKSVVDTITSTRTKRIPTPGEGVTELKVADYVLLIMIDIAFSCLGWNGLGFGFGFGSPFPNQLLQPALMYTHFTTNKSNFSSNLNRLHQYFQSHAKSLHQHHTHHTINSNIIIIPTWDDAFDVIKRYMLSY